MSEIKALTSLRGLFALWVVLFHLRVWSYWNFEDWTGLIAQGYLAVDFFFCLSGYVLAGAYGGRFAADWTASDYIYFASRRFGRLFPLHIFATFVLLGVGFAITGHYYSPLQVANELALTHRWSLWPASAETINAPDWSISTEWAASLMFPIFAFMILGGSALRAMTSAAIGLALLVYAGSQHDWSLAIWRGDDPPWPLVRCFAEFGLGVALFRFRDRLPSFPAISRLLAKEPLHWLGLRSYSLYLLHLPVLMSARKLARELPFQYQSAAYVFGSLAAVLIVASLGYRLIEVPAREFVYLAGDRWSRNGAHGRMELHAGAASIDLDPVVPDVSNSIRG